MENPATWGAAENVIHNAIVKDHYAMQAEPGLCGFSLPKQIADALRTAGLLTEKVRSEEDQVSLVEETQVPGEAGPGEAGRQGPVQEGPVERPHPPGRLTMVSAVSIYNNTTGAARTVLNEIPGATRGFIRMPWPLKITWACCVAFYAFMGASLQNVPMAEHVAWYSVFTVLWTVMFAASAAWLDAKEEIPWTKLS